MMLKRILCLLAVLLLTIPAAAEPRYPSKSGVATDAAAVFSISLLEDLRKLDKRLDKADAPQLYIATVDFLDGADVESYVNALFSRWNLEDDEMLLLIAVGEEAYAIASGKNVDRLVSQTTQTKLLSGHFREPFMNQQYDAAVAAFVPALALEFSKACGKTIRTDDLFGSSSSSLIVDWASNLSRYTTRDEEESIISREEENTGFSLLKVAVIIVLLVLIFGSFKRMRKEQKPLRVTRRREPHVYFKPRQQKPVEQYFQPRRPQR